MATKKDLVEAHTFSRRRLVTAFVSGAPGGREVEPVKPGRVLIGGIALSVLMLAGAAIAGFLLGRPPAGWLEAGSFVISKDTGEQYVVLRGGEDAKLQRVPNYISAQLLIGESDLTPFTVRDKYIRDVPLGSDLGIEGAPASLPDPDLLLSEGWTACTADGDGVKVALSDRQLVEDLTDSAFVVRSESTKTYWLIATEPDQGTRPGRALRYALPRRGADGVASALKFPSVASSPEVSSDWLNLFPVGSSLTEDQFGITREGEPASYAGSPTDFSDHTIGTLLRLAGGSRYFLLADEGVMELSPFAAELYNAIVSPAVDYDGNPQVTRLKEEFPADWSASLPQPVASGPMCAVLHPSSDGRTRVSLAHRPRGEADPEGVSPGTHTVFVQPSRGAYVLSGSDTGEGGGTPYVIDSKALRYALIGPEVPGSLGFGSQSAPVVPNTWMDFFDPGVSLSSNAARRVPEDARQSGSESEE